MHSTIIIIILKYDNNYCSCSSRAQHVHTCSQGLVEYALSSVQSYVASRGV